MTYCIGCQTELIPFFDADPNGDMNSVCARCRAEEEHDFDKQPGVWFDRAGRIHSPWEQRPGQSPLFDVQQALEEIRKEIG